MTNRPWFPTILSEQCDGCKGVYKCVTYCPNGVLEIRDEKAFVVDPLGCVYGCSACANLCPKDAIIFPTHETSSRVIRKNSFLHRVVCKRCGKRFLTDRETEVCFDCEDTLRGKEHSPSNTKANRGGNGSGKSNCEGER